MENTLAELKKIESLKRAAEKACAEYLLRLIETKKPAGLIVVLDPFASLQPGAPHGVWASTPRGKEAS